MDNPENLYQYILVGTSTLVELDEELGRRFLECIVVDEE